MKKIYEDGTYLTNNPTWHEEDSSWKADQVIKILQRNSLTPASVCEIGCGAGEILNQLSVRMGDTVHFFGYEISPQAYALCQTKKKPNLAFKLIDLFREEDAYFDVVMAIDVIEHIEDFYSFLVNLKQRAEYKVFHIPLDISVQTVLRCSPIMKSRTLFGHIHYFTKETAIASLRDSGYEILDYFYTKGSLELPNQGWKAFLLRVPRQIAFLVNEDIAVRILGGHSLMVLAR